MDFIGEYVDHPIAMVVALALSVPFIWQVARSWFSGVEEDVKEAAPFLILDVLGGPAFLSWPIFKLIGLVIVAAAFVTMFYKFGSWIAEF